MDHPTTIGEIPAAVDPMAGRCERHRHLTCELHFRRTRPYHASAALRPDAPEDLRCAARTDGTWAIDDLHRAAVTRAVTIFDIPRHDRESTCLSPACGGKFRTGICSDAWGHTGLVVAASARTARDSAAVLPVPAPHVLPVTAPHAYCIQMLDSILGRLSGNPW